MVDLLDKGANLTGLFNSKIFNVVFDYDEWPATNTNTQSMIMPYNETMFNMRFQYPIVFKEIYDLDKKREIEMKKAHDHSHCSSESTLY